MKSVKIVLLISGLILIGLISIQMSSEVKGCTQTTPNCVLEAYSVRWNTTANSGYNLTYTVWNSVNASSSPTIYVFTAAPYTVATATVTTTFSGLQSKQFSNFIYGPEVEGQNQTAITLTIGELVSGTYLFQDYQVVLADSYNNDTPVVIDNNICVNITINVYLNQTINFNNTNYVPISIINNNTVLINNVEYVEAVVNVNNTIMVNETQYIPISFLANNSITINNTVYSPIDAFINNSVTVYNNNTLDYMGQNYIPVTIFSNETIEFNNSNWIPISLVENLTLNDNVSVVNNATIITGIPLDLRNGLLYVGLACTGGLFLIAQYPTTAQRPSEDAKKRRQLYITQNDIHQSIEEWEEKWTAKATEQSQKARMGNFLALLMAIVTFYLVDNYFNPVGHFQFEFGYEIFSLLWAEVIYFAIQTVYSVRIRDIPRRLMWLAILLDILILVYNDHWFGFWMPVTILAVVCGILTIIKINNPFQYWFGKQRKTRIRPKDEGSPHFQYNLFLGNKEDE